MVGLCWPANLEPRHLHTKRGELATFEISSRIVCRFPLVPESPDHAVDYDLEAFVSRQMGHAIFLLRLPEALVPS
jgi:hypothetical protein